MKTTSLTLAVLSAASLLGAATVHAQSRNQAGGLPALAAEVAALRAMVEDLQAQVGNDDPYNGTYSVTLVETAVFGCRAVNANPPAPNYVPQYFLPLNASSVSLRSAAFEAEADGSMLHVPDFDIHTQEVKLSGFYAPMDEVEEGASITIASDGSFSATLDDSELVGQFSDDGSMFTALVVGTEAGPGSCQDGWTVHLTGARQ